MQPEHRAWIKKCVLDNLAPVHEGKIMMSDIIRLFGDYGDRQELAQVLDEMVKDSQARKIMKDDGDVAYVFPIISRRIGAAILEEKRSLEREADQIKRRIGTERHRIEMIEKICLAWGGPGWTKLLPDSTKRTIVLHYINSFWRKEQNRILADTYGLSQALAQITDRISALEKRLEDSFGDP